MNIEHKEGKRTNHEHRIWVGCDNLSQLYLLLCYCNLITSSYILRILTLTLQGDFDAIIK